MLKSEPVNKLEPVYETETAYNVLYMLFLGYLKKFLFYSLANRR